MSSGNNPCSPDFGLFVMKDSKCYVNEATSPFASPLDETELQESFVSQVAHGGPSPGSGLIADH